MSADYLPSPTPLDPSTITGSPRWFEHPDYLEQLLTDHAERRQRISQLARSFTPDIGDNWVRLRQAHPTLPPGPLMAMAQQGMSPDDPFVTELARLSAEHQTHDGIGWHTFGEVLGGAGSALGWLLSPVGDALGTVGRAVDTYVEPVVRVPMTILQSGIEEVGSLWSGIMAASDHASADGMTPLNPRYWGRFADELTGAGEGASTWRLAGGGSSVGMQAIRQIGENIGEMGMGPGGARSPMDAFEGIHLGEGIIPGGPQGSFENLYPATREAITQQQLDPRTGRPYTVGRGVANLVHTYPEIFRPLLGDPTSMMRQQMVSAGIAPPSSIADYEFFEPGSREHNMLSGLVDGTMTLFGDPAGAALGAYAIARQASRYVGKTPEYMPTFRRAIFGGRTTNEAGEVVATPGLARFWDPDRAAAIQGSGAVFGVRRTVDMPTVLNDYLHDLRNVPMWRTQADISSPRELYNLLGRNTPRQMLNELAAADDVDKVKAVWRDWLPSLGMKKPRHATDSLGITLRRKVSNRRIFGQVPGAAIPDSRVLGNTPHVDAHDVDASLVVFNDLLTHADVARRNPELADAYFAEFAALKDGDYRGMWDVMDRFASSVSENLIGEAYGDEVVKAWRAARKKMLDDLNKSAAEGDIPGRIDPTTARHVDLNKLLLDKVGVKRTIKNPDGTTRTVTEVPIPRWLRNKRGNLSSPDWGKSIMRYWSDTQKKLTSYVIDKQGEELTHPLAHLGRDPVTGEVTLLEPSPFLYTQSLHNAIPLPNLDELRALTSRFGRAINSIPLARGTINRLAGGMENVWKPLTLLRAAWVVRVVGEENVRMGAAGLDSFLTNPLGFISWMTGKRGSIDVAGNYLSHADDFIAAMSRGSGGFRASTPGWIHTGNWVKMHKGQLSPDEFAQSWAENWLQHADDPVLRQYVEAVHGAGIKGTVVTPGQAARPAQTETRLNIDLSPLSDAERRALDTIGRTSGNPLVAGVNQLEGSVDPITRRISSEWGAKNARLTRERGGEIVGSSRLIHNLDAAKGMVDEVLDEYRRLLDPSDPMLQHMELVQSGLKKLDPMDHVRPVDEIIENATDEIAEAIETQTFQGIDGFKEWFWTTTEGRKWRTNLMDGRTRLAELSENLITSRDYSNWYVDVLTESLGSVTNNSADLITAILTGTLDGNVIRHGRADLKTLRKSFVNRMDSSPQWVRYNQEVVPTGGTGRSLRHKQEKDAVVESLFDFLMSRRTNYLSRSPAFKQFYWRAMEDLLPWADDATKATILSRARQASLSKNQLGRMSRSAASSSGGVETLDVIDTLGKARGLDETRALLYDLTKKSQFADITRNIFPFAEAWKEILTTWSKLAYNHPQSVYRGQRGIQEGRTTNPLNVDDPTGRGFFYVDPVTNQETFAYPGGGLISKWLLGHSDAAALGFQGTVRGANIFAATVMPGFGPVVQMPASMFMPSAPEWEWARDILLPFGEANLESPGDIINTVLPPYMKRFITATFQGGSLTPDAQRTYNNTVMDMATVLVATGQYSTTSEAAIEELLSAAKSRTRMLFFIRSLAQFTAPTGPEVRFYLADRDDNFIMLNVLADTYRRHLESTGDPYETFQWFHQRFGHDPLLLRQGKTISLNRRSTHVSGYEWEKANPDLVSRHREVIGMFAPNTDETFSFDAYREQLDLGDRQTLTPDTWIRLANASAGAAAMAHLEAQVEGRTDPSAEAWLRANRAHLQEWFPGFGVRIPGVPERAELETTINRLRDAAADSDLRAAAEPGAIEGLEVYLGMRDAALEQLASAGYTTLSSNAAAPIRTWLRTQGQALIKEYPAFASSWEMVLSRELD